VFQEGERADHYANGAQTRRARDLGRKREVANDDEGVGGYFSKGQVDRHSMEIIEGRKRKRSGTRMQLRS